MAVVFAYTNRYRDIVDVEEGQQVDGNGLPIGPASWASRIQKVAFWHLIPSGNSFQGAPDDSYSRGVIRGSCSITDLKASVQAWTTAGDYLIVDFDSAEPKYFIKKGVKSFRVVRENDLPHYIKEHIDAMNGYGARHLCYGEKINQDSQVSIFTCNLEDIDFSNFQPVQRTAPTDLWAIAYGVYYAECVANVYSSTLRQVSVIEREQVASHIMANPDSLGTPLYVYKQPGEVVTDEEGADVLVYDGVMYRWMDVCSSGLVLDQIVRVFNPDMERVSRDEPVLYGDLIFHTDDTWTVAEEPTPGQFGTSLSPDSFASTSIIGHAVGNRTVYRRRHRDAPLDTRFTVFFGYRFLNRDDHVQEGDFQFEPDGTIRPATNIGKKLSENSNTLFRAIGKDGWGVIVRDQITEDMEVQWQVRDRGKVWIDWTPWIASRDSEQLQEYERQYYTVYFRKKVPGFRTVRRGDPYFQLPYGLEWVPLEVAIQDGDLEIVNGQLTSASRASIGKPCKESHIYVRSTPNQYHEAIPWPSILSLASPVVEHCGKFLGAVRISNPTGHQLVVSRHGISMVPVSSVDVFFQATPIGSFYPHVFKINGQEQIIYCTDQVNDSELSALVSRGIQSILGVVERHLPFLSVTPAKPASATVRREVRAIEL